MSDRPTTPGGFSDDALGFLLYMLFGACIGGGGMVMVSALLHFIAWTPFATFPWGFARFGLAVGLLVGAAIAWRDHRRG